jgi:hypothetical protein
MNLLLWGCKTWSAQKSLLMKLKVFLILNVQKYSSYQCIKSRRKNNKRSSRHLKQWKVNAADMYLTFSRSTLMEKEIMKAGTRANVSLYPNLVICPIQTSGRSKPDGPTVKDFSCMMKVRAFRYLISMAQSGN